jgi:exodeoxyribonuclease V alpha subunit
VKLLVRERIPRKFGLQPLDDVQVLTPMHKGLLGVASLNTELHALFNPDGMSIVHGSRFFRVGGKVMQIRNNYELEVFNGDIDRVEAVDDIDRTVSVRFDNRLVTYDVGDLDELVLAYASPSTRRRGSEYPAWFSWCTPSTT